MASLVGHHIKEKKRGFVACRTISKNCEVPILFTMVLSATTPSAESPVVAVVQSVEDVWSVVAVHFASWLPTETAFQAAHGNPRPKITPFVEDVLMSLLVAESSPATDAQPGPNMVFAPVDPVTVPALPFATEHSSPFSQGLSASLAQLHFASQSPKDLVKPPWLMSGYTVHAGIVVVGSAVAEQTPAAKQYLPLFGNVVASLTFLHVCVPHLHSLFSASIFMSRGHMVMSSAVQSSSHP